MPIYYDAFGRPSRVPTPQAGRPARQVTLEDYQRLTQAYEGLQTEHQRLQSEYAAQKDQIQELTGLVAQKEQVLAVIKEKLNETQDALDAQQTMAQNANQAAAQAAARAGVDESVWKDRLARLQAEVDNIRRRNEDRLATEIADARSRILLDMIPVADHLELALEHSQALGESPAGATFLSNIEATRQAFLSALSRYGVEQIAALGEPFDPNLHEALGQKQAPEIPADHVAQVVHNGYTNGDRLVRPARVMVSSGPEA